MTANFKWGEATYTIAPTTQKDNQQVVNLAVGLLRQIADDMGWQVRLSQTYRDAAIKNGDDPKTLDSYRYLASYPAVAQDLVTDYVWFFLKTTIEGDVQHPIPQTSLHLTSPKLFYDWLAYVDKNPDHIAQWDATFKEANGVSTDPLSGNGDKPSATTS